MPIVVNPGYVWPPETDPVVSPDGRITAIVDPAHAGVLLRADYSSDPLVAKVRFERQDGSVVRSGNPAWAPGGYAHAYDHEATLGGGTLWRTVPIKFDDSEGTPSEYVGAVIPGLSDGWGWFKPVADPNKALLLRVEPPDLDYNGRVDTTSIAASRRPAATWDLLEGFSTQLRSLVKERTVEDQLMHLLDLGPVLAQFPACAGIPDFFFIRERVTAEHVHWDGYPWRRYTIPVVSVDRPTTIDTPLRIPDLSYDTVERDWVSYDQLEATVDSYNDLLTAGDENDPIVWDGGYPTDDSGIVIDGGQP